MRVTVNFASREYLLARKVYVSLLAGTVLSLGVLVYQFTLYSSASGRISELETSLSEATAIESAAMARYKEISGPVNQAEVEKTIEETNFANNVIINKSFSWTLFLNRLEGLIPKGVGITTISPDFRTLKVTIAGSADDIDKLIEFIDMLTGSEYFEDLPPSFSTTRQIVDKDTGKTVEVFNLSIKYYPEGSDGKG